MKKLFTAIRKCDLETVKSLLDKSPELISCISVGAPKKDEGQSPLQVALKASSTEIVELLLERGADVNFIETETDNPWRAPVIHDAIIRAIMSSRWNVVGPDGLEVFSTKEKAESAFTILERIIDMGADVNAKDSTGNSCLCRALTQAYQIVPKSYSSDRILTDELKSDLSRIFKLLIFKGADVNYTTSKATFSYYANEPVSEFLKH